MKKGISLITLIITIIVIIILATAIILSLNNTNIIANANKAVESSNMATMQDKVNLINMDLKVKMETENSEYGREAIIEALKKEMQIKNENVNGNLLKPDNSDFEIVVNKDNTIDVVKKGDRYPDAELLKPEDEKLFETVNNADGSVSITKYLGNSSSIKIPEKINGKAVTAIKNLNNGKSDFSNENLKSIFIPDSVIEIGDDTFKKNTLESVKLSNKLESIGSYAFAWNNLNTIEIPDSVTKIGEGAFRNNQLVSVKLSSKIKKIEQWTFAINKLESIEIPNGVTTIGQAAFGKNNLKTLSLPDSVIEIGDLKFGNGMGAFGYNKISELKLSNNLEIIGLSTFSNNKLVNLEVPNSVKKICESAFENNNLKNIKLPDKLELIGVSAFNSNQLPEDQAYIYARDVNGNEDKTKLSSYGGTNKKIVIPESVTKIDKGNFDFESFEEVVILGQLTELGSGAFAFNENLKRVEFKGDVPSKLGHLIFDYKENLKIKVPKGKLNNYKTATSVSGQPPSITWFFTWDDMPEYLNAFYE